MSRLRCRNAESRRRFHVDVFDDVPGCAQGALDRRSRCKRTDRVRMTVQLTRYGSREGRVAEDVKQIAETLRARRIVRRV